MIYATRNVLEIEFYPSWNILEYTGISFLYCCTNPADSKSFSTVKAGCADRLMSARLMYFESMARQFDEFLVRYQTDKPVVPFLCGDLDILVRGLCQRFIKKSVLEEASTTAQLSRLQVDDANTHLPHAKIDAGFCADKNLKELAAADAKVSERDRMAFRMECKKALSAPHRNSC